MIGGIVEYAGLQCPVERFELESGGDIIQDNMKRLVDVMRKLVGGELGFQFQELIGFCCNEEIFIDILGDVDEENSKVLPKVKSAIGKTLRKYNERRFNFPLEGLWEFKITGSGRSKRYFVNEII